MMKSVSVSDLKARLSQYLREVRRGSEIQVLDRGVPVARLVQAGNSAATDPDAHRQRLIASGILRPGSGKSAAVLKSPPVKLRVNLSDALLDERSDRL